MALRGTSLILVVTLIYACGAPSERIVARPASQQQRHAFAGFSMELPPWRLRASGANSYVAGVAELVLADQRVSLLWWRGEQLPGFDVHAAAARIGNGTRVVELAPPGVVGYTMETPLDTQSRFMSLIKCDGRMITVNSTLTGGGGLALHSSLIKSFRCIPEPAAATRPDPKFVTIAIPSAWSVEVSPRGQMPTTVYGSVAEGSSIVVETRPDLEPNLDFDGAENVKKQMTTVTTELVVEPVQNAVGKDVRFTALLRGVPIVGYSTAIVCAKLQAVAYILGMSADATKADEIYATIKRATCADAELDR